MFLNPKLTDSGALHKLNYKKFLIFYLAKATKVTFDCNSASN